MSTHAWRAVALFVLLGSACSGGSESATTIAAPPPSPVHVLPHSVRLALGHTFSCLLTEARTVMCWGELPAENAGLAPEDRVVRPHEIPGMRGAIEIAASSTTLCARLGDRRILCWGEDAMTVPGAREVPGPREVSGLDGTRSLAVGARGVCAIAGDELRCIGQNRAPIVGAVSSGAVLLSVAGSVCAVDGAGPARCLAPSADTLTEVAGSEGAVSVALADGVCIVSASGELRCDASTGTPSDAHVASIAAAPRAVWIAGGDRVRCVARRSADGDEEATARVTCDRSEGGMGPAHSTLESPISALAAAGSSDRGWHACALIAHDDVRCWGADIAGEVQPTRPFAGVRRIVDAPAASEIAIVGRHLVVLDRDGALHVRSLVREETGPAIAGLGVLRSLRAIDGQACALDAGGALVCVLPDSGAATRVDPFGATGPIFAVRQEACAPAAGNRVVCAAPGARAFVERAEGGLSEPTTFEGELCGVRGGAIRCEPTGRLRHVPRTFPTQVAHLFAGEEQLFAIRRDGSVTVLGHNGVGQLGLPPSRPIDLPTASTLPAGTTAMAFTFHASCAWGPGVPLSCAGLDDALAPRTPMALEALVPGGPPEIDRGDGGWAEIPGVRDVTSVSLDRFGGCAADAAGAVWCWGLWPEGIERARVSEPTPVRLHEG